MKKYFLDSLTDKIGQTVDIFGWVASIRDHKKVVFIDLRDRTGIIQVVGDATFAQLNPEDVVRIKGIVKERPEKLVNPNIKTGNFEIEALEYELLSKAQTLPFDFNKDTLDVTLPILLDYRPLTLRHPKIRDIFDVQAAIMSSFRKTVEALGCIEVFVPTISASATEGGAEVFKLDYYGHNAFLTQSPQLYKQMMVPVFERVYLASHAYRAEPSVTTRHLSEVTQLDCEFGFVDFDELLDLLEKVCKETLKNAAETTEEIFKNLNLDTPLLDGTIPRVTLKEAQEIILKTTGRDNVGEPDLSPQDEIDIATWAKESHKSDLVTITHFPTKKRAFYTMPDPKNPQLSLSYDILFKGLEIASGSQRIHNYDQLVSAIKERGMKEADFELYLMAFKYGMPPEGGFSFGLERMTMKMLNLANIREASLFPRDMERIDIHLPTHDQE